MPWPIKEEKSLSSPSELTTLKLKKISENIYVDESDNQYGLIPATFLEDSPMNEWAYYLVKGIRIYLWVLCPKNN